jgi:DmsE family decaheme c-type cytochrome
MRAARGDDEKVLAAMQLIFSFKGSPDENSSRCLSCHVTTHEQALFNRSEHKLQGVACQTCHSPHLPQTANLKEKDWLDNKLLKKTQPALCFDCHKVIQGQFSLPNHHKVPEGLMDCTDCHNPHGTRNQPMLRKTSWEACIACHQEKRGPFVFEHAAAKVEGCATCHSPHGSVNRMMLLRTEGRFMCLQCHVDPHAPNVPHGRAGFATRGECVRCHVTIHGSHSSEFFLN